MKFLVIEVNEGGAGESYEEYEDVKKYLFDSGYWDAAYHAFVDHGWWSPGEFMDYPCGWIICIGTNEPVHTNGGGA